MSELSSPNSPSTLTKRTPLSLSCFTTLQPETLMETLAPSLSPKPPKSHQKAFLWPDSVSPMYKFIKTESICLTILKESSHLSMIIKRELPKFKELTSLLKESSLPGLYLFNSLPLSPTSLLSLKTTSTIFNRYSDNTKLLSLLNTPILLKMK